MIRTLLSIIFCISLGAVSANTLRVVDDKDNVPLASAAVFSESGLIIGLTDKNGEIEIKSDAYYPITVKCTGYAPTQCDAGITTAFMQQIPIKLSEVVVTPDGRPVIRMIFYTREYFTGVNETDTVIEITESMQDFFIPAKEKLKGFKKSKALRTLSTRVYRWRKDDKGKDTVTMSNRMISSSDNIVDFSPKISKKDKKKVRSGNGTDTIPGKYSPKMLIRRNPEDSSVFVRYDMLADNKNHMASPNFLKLLGMTIDMSESLLTGRYDDNGKDAEVFPIENMQFMSLSLNMLMKGKLYKSMYNSDSPIRSILYEEIYPVGREYLTVEEANVLKNYTSLNCDIKASDDAGPIDAAYQRIIDRYNDEHSDTK